MIRLRLALSGSVREYAFHRPEIHIGRSPMNDLPIPVEGVSVRHGRLRLEGAKWIYEDRDSLRGSALVREGTASVIHGERTVQDGDVLVIGDAARVELLSTGERDALGDKLRHTPFSDDPNPASHLSLAPLAQLAQLAISQAAQPSGVRFAAEAAEIVAAVVGTPLRAGGLLWHGRGPARAQFIDGGDLRGGALEMKDVDRTRLLAMIQGPGLITHPIEGGMRVIISAFDSPNAKAQALITDLDGEGLDGTPSKALLGLAESLAPLLVGLARFEKQQERNEAVRAENRYFRERQRRHYLFKELVTESDAMRAVYRQLSDMVEQRGPVLLSGEAGSGKELIARAVHHLSKRSESLMVSIRCGRMPSEDLDLELFGSGAGGQVGVLELSHGGTVFLNEIDRLSPLLQAKLLRVIKEGEVRRHGEEIARHVDVRLVLATHHDLGQLVSEGRFRHDLFAALREQELGVPPLRERPEDIMPLATIFVEVFSRRYGTTGLTFTPDAEARLLSYDWPGNVRELQGVIESGVLNRKTGAITVEDLGV